MYELMDSGDGEKLERFGKYVLQRPCGQALWQKEGEWKCDARFTRADGWTGNLPKMWEAEHEGIRFKLKATDFGHVGMFPEHAEHWKWMCEQVAGRQARVLNLFAYSGGATLALAKAGVEVCHVDAAKGMVDWARENAALNGLEDRPIRWIVDDAIKFLKREVRRGSRYEGVILDPPSFGRGAQGQVFKIEEDLPSLLQLCQEVLSDQPRFMLLSCHTPGITPLVLKHLVGGECGEMVISGKRDLPCGSYARVSYV